MPRNLVITKTRNVVPRKPSVALTSTVVIARKLASRTAARILLKRKASPYELKEATSAVLKKPNARLKRRATTAPPKRIPASTVACLISFADTVVTLRKTMASVAPNVRNVVVATLPATKLKVVLK